jgi:bla regulator protein blaR1
MPRPRTRLTPSVFLAVCLAGVTVTPRAQDQAPSSPSPASVAEPKFEVTSVKKSGPNRQGGPFRFGMQPGGRFTVSGMPVSALLTMAYGIQRFQLIGGPSWINSDRFDINAVAEDVPVQPTPPGTPNRMQLLLRSLLKDRFALVVHNETRELPVSYLVVAREDRKLGDRLRPSTVDCRALFAARGRGAAPFEPPKPGEVPPCGMMGGFGRIAAGSIPMTQLASMLANMLSRPVYDRTNLSGNFDIQLDYTPDQMPQIPQGATLPPGFTLPSPDGPSLNTALQEQLGLKLDATRGPVDVLVIDSVAQPEPD